VSFRFALTSMTLNDFTDSQKSDVRGCYLTTGRWIVLLWACFRCTDCIQTVSRFIGGRRSW